MIRRSALLLVLLLAAAPVLAQGLDVSGWELQQANSTQSFTLPPGTVVPAGGYLIVARDVDQAAFETYYGVSLGSNAVFVRSSNSVPMINGDETYSVLNGSGGLEDGPTDPVTTTRRSYHRPDPESTGWATIDESPSPAAGVEAPDATLSGLVITEVTDPSDYAYEYLELYYDGTTGTSNQTPAISAVAHAPAAPQAGDAITVSANVVDPDGALDTVRCYWRAGGGSYQIRVMANTSGDQYSTTFTGLPADVWFEYYLFARDDEAAEALNPATAPAVVHSVWIQGATTPGKTILFDHAHDQDAGSNGNWRIDDNFPDPYPAAPTSETSWNGQLSSWAFELYQEGHTVRSNTTALSAALLADVDLLVIPEPQNPFTAAEKEAVRQFVFDGGSLFMIADHNSSDRNNNGWDSPSIFGGYTVPHITTPIGSDTETFAGALFGLHFHVKDEGNNSISGSYTNVNPDPSNPVIHGPWGEVTGVYYHVGNVMTLWPSANPHLSDLGGIVSKDGGSPHLAAWSRYGQGKVFGYGDSSSMADGTGSESHADNWSTEASHRELFLNATDWLLTSDATHAGDLPFNPGLDLRVSPNPFNPSTAVRFTMPRDGVVEAGVYDLQGRLVRTLHAGQLPAGPAVLQWNGRTDAGRDAPSGVYLVRVRGAGFVNVSKAVLAK